MPTEPFPAVKVSPPPQLSQELIDLIITRLIHLHAHDPATQWTRLRHITRYHRTLIDKHFLTYWLPHLTISIPEVCLGGTGTATYKAHSVKRKSGIVNFRGEMPKGHTHPVVSPIWAHLGTWPTRHMYDGKVCISRIASPLLNKGYVGGGIVSDVMIRDVQCDETGLNLWFDWRALFTDFFNEEMVLRRVREEMLSEFVEGLRVTKKNKRDERIWAFLRDRWVTVQREVLVLWRTDRLLLNGKAYGNTLPKEKHAYGSLDRIFREQSVIFFVPGWEHWKVRKVAKYRAREDMGGQNLYQCEPVSVAAPGSYSDRLERRWRGWLGEEERSEEELENELRSEHV